MTLSDVRTGVERRYRELRLFFGVIKELTPKRPGPVTVGATVIKGLFFVHMYSLMEYCVQGSVQRTLRAIGDEAPRLNAVLPVVLSLALHPECQGLVAVGPNKVWSKRRELFTKAASDDPVAFDDAVMPTDTSNLRYEQLADIWATFGIAEPVLPRLSLRGRLSEITEHRNAISHGRESPATIGSRLCNERARIPYDGGSRDLRVRCADVRAVSFKEMLPALRSIEECQIDLWDAIPEARWARCNGV